MRQKIQTAPTLDLPELAPYRTMRWQGEHRRLGLFVAEGEKVVRRLLECPIPIVSMLLETPWLNKLQPLIDARSESINIFLADKNLFSQITGYPFFQGVLAVGRIPPPQSLRYTLNACPHPRLFVALEGITNPINIGSIVRNCVAFGAQALILSPTSSSPYLRRAVRNSMGAIFHIPVIESENLVNTFHQLKANEIRCFAAHPTTQKSPPANGSLQPSCCIVFGNEGEGLTKETLQNCDSTLSIPMTPLVDSLNVASASAVLLYEVLRQRSLSPQKTQGKTSFRDISPHIPYKSSK